jgi:hypothetical protein
VASPDLALDALRKIAQDFATFLAGKGSVSEADTRANLIDKVLIQVLGWPESAVTREEHVDRGRIDYSLYLQTRRYVAVECIHFSNSRAPLSKTFRCTADR